MMMYWEDKMSSAFKKVFVVARTKKKNDLFLELFFTCCFGRERQHKIFGGLARWATSISPE